MNSKGLILSLVLMISDPQAFAQISTNSIASTSVDPATFEYAEMAISNTCPYEIRSEDASKLQSEVTAELSKYKMELEKNKQNCSVDVKGIETYMATLTPLIDSISRETFPEDREMKSLLIANQPFQCSNNVNSLNQFLNSYLTQAINDKINGIKTTLLSGELGALVNKTLDDCHTQFNSDQTKLEQCIYGKLYGSTTASISNGSEVAKQWLSDCRKISDLDSTGWINKMNREARETETKQKALTATIQSILKTSDLLSNSIAGIDDANCKNLKTLKNSASALAQAALTTAGALVGPMGSLGAAFLAPSVQAILNRIGSNQKKINQIKKMEDAFNNLDENQHQRFACNLYRANQMNCEYLSRTYYEPVRTEQCKPSPEQRSLVTLTYLSTILEQNLDPMGASKNNSNKEPINGQDLSMYALSDAEKSGRFYNSLFEPSLTMKDGKEVSVYQYLFDDNGVHKALAKQFEGATQYDKAKIKSGILHLNQIKQDLDSFRDQHKKYINDLEGTTKINLQSMNQAMQKLRSKEYEDAIYSFLKSDYPTKDGDSSASKQAGIGFVVNDMKTSIAMNGISILEPQVVSSSDMATDLKSTLNTFYGEFLGESSFIKKEYQKWLEKNAAKENKKAREIANKKEYETNPSDFFNNVIYPRYRDCMLNYQFAINPEKDGRVLDKNYKKYCGFLSGCKLPFKIDGNEQADFTSSNRKNFKACSIMSQYRSIETKIKDELKGKEHTVCGKKPEDLFND